jgi:hypothetical protein
LAVAANILSFNVDFDVSTITRYNICRLIITIHCSSYTISLQDINKILESSDNITKSEIEILNIKNYEIIKNQLDRKKKLNKIINL